MADNERKQENKQVLAELLCSSMALSAMMEPYPHVERKPSYNRCGMTGKQWGRAKARQTMAKKARRRNR